jgi:hypothetical protein
MCWGLFFTEICRQIRKFLFEKFSEMSYYQLIENLKLLKNAASPLAGEPQITGACFRRQRRRKMFELI